MTSVFLSYDREDASTARRLAAALERCGHAVWWDRRIRGGAEFSDEIDRALAAAEAVVVLWSKKSIASAWVRDEAGAGRDRGRLLPIRIDDCSPPLGFRQYQTIDLPSGRLVNSEALAELDDALAKIGTAAADAVTLPRPPKPSLTRRRTLVGLAAATSVAAAGGALWLYKKTGSRRPPVPKEVEPLVVQAKQLLNQNTREGQYQAIGLYQRVVQMAPDWADGWGLLGYTYAVICHYRERPEGLALRAKAEAAGRHALELDAGSALGELALGVALPFIGSYTERDQRLTRAHLLDPDEDEVRIMLGVVLQMVGRSVEAVPFYRQVQQKRLLTPAEYYNFLAALWCAGQVVELDQAVRDAASLYPTQTSIWFARLAFALYSGRFAEVRALVEDEPGRPSDITDERVQQYLAIATAIENRNPTEVDTVMAQQMEEARKSAIQAEFAIRNANALGRVDEAYRITNAYYFGEGFIVPDFATAGSGFNPEERQTRFLFQPVTKPMRHDARFEPLMKRLGLDAYWHASGKAPDYRRVAGL